MEKLYTMQSSMSNVEGNRVNTLSQSVLIVWAGGLLSWEMVIKKAVIHPCYGQGKRISLIRRRGDAWASRKKWQPATEANEESKFTMKK